MDREFEFYIPVNVPESLLKGGDEAEWVIRGPLGSERMDAQGDVVVGEAVRKGLDYYVANGAHVDWEHRSVLDRVNALDYICGRGRHLREVPAKGGGKTWELTAVLFKDNEYARKAYRHLKNGGQLAFSIGGSCSRDPKHPEKVVSTKISHVALTPYPVNVDAVVGLASLAKSLGAGIPAPEPAPADALDPAWVYKGLESLTEGRMAKTLAASGAAAGFEATGFRGLVGEDLEGHAKETSRPPGEEDSPEDCEGDCGEGRRRKGGRSRQTGRRGQETHMNKTLDQEEKSFLQKALGRFSEMLKADEDPDKLKAAAEAARAEEAAEAGSEPDGDEDPTAPAGAPADDDGAEPDGEGEPDQLQKSEAEEAEVVGFDELLKAIDTTVQERLAEALNIALGPVAETAATLQKSLSTPTDELQKSVGDLGARIAGIEEALTRMGAMARPQGTPTGAQPLQKAQDTGAPTKEQISETLLKSVEDSPGAIGSLDMLAWNLHGQITPKAQAVLDKAGIRIPAL